jgi:CHAT domain-containing protein
LTVDDICGLTLNQCGLVSLAACETAVTGTDTIQAEYVGLASAFLKAGAGAVLSTLWTVESVSNAWLMVYFYEQLEAGQSPAVALQAAQTWLQKLTYRELVPWLRARLTPALQTADSEVYAALETELTRLASADSTDSNLPLYSDPYYWAAFVLAGFS